MSVKKFKARHLREDEEVVASFTGWKGKLMGRGRDRQVNGTFILTNQRVVFYKKTLFSEHFESIERSRILNAEFQKTLGYRRIVVYTAGDALEFKTHGRGGAELDIIRESLAA